MIFPLFGIKYGANAVFIGWIRFVLKEIDQIWIKRLGLNMDQIILIQSEGKKR